MENPKSSRCVYLKPSFDERGSGPVLAACASPTRRGDSTPWCWDVSLNEKNCPMAVSEPKMGTEEYGEWRLKARDLMVRARRRAVVHPDYLS